MSTFRNPYLQGSEGIENLAEGIEAQQGRQLDVTPSSNLSCGALPGCPDKDEDPQTAEYCNKYIESSLNILDYPADGDEIHVTVIITANESRLSDGRIGSGSGSNTKEGPPSSSSTAGRCATQAAIAAR